MTNEEIALELTKAWVDKATPATWYQVAEAYSGLLLTVQRTNGDSDQNTEKTAHLMSGVSVLAQKGLNKLSACGTLNQFETELKQKSK